ncbi:MAG: hypothetical protein QJR02_07130 [Sinobacteraceae bacterium]|nr:hypothetical protein [Nevskiaceae bacterium]
MKDEERQLLERVAEVWTCALAPRLKERALVTPADVAECLALLRSVRATLRIRHKRAAR